MDKQKFDALTDLVEHTQKAELPQQSQAAPSDQQIVLDAQGEKVILDDKNVR